MFLMATPAIIVPQAVESVCCPHRPDPTPAMGDENQAIGTSEVDNSVLGQPAGGGKMEDSLYFFH